MPKKIQSVIESAKDSESEPAEANGANKTTPDVKKKDSGNREYITGLRGGCYYINSSGKKTYVDKDKCN